MKEGIRQENLNLLVNSEMILKRLNKKNIFFNIDDKLTKLYLDQLRIEFTKEELKLMNKTLENDISASVSKQSTFIAVFSVLVVLITTIFSYTNSIATGGEEQQNIALISFVLICYIVMVISYHFRNQIINEKKIKLLNHLNLIIALDDQ